MINSEESNRLAMDRKIRNRFILIFIIILIVIIISVYNHYSHTNQIKTISEKIDSLRIDNNLLKVKLNRSQSYSEQIKRKYEETDSLLLVQINITNKLNTHLFQKEAEKKELEESIRHLKREFNRNNNLLNKKKEEIQLLRKELRQKDNKIRELETNNKELKKEIDSLKNKYEHNESTNNDSLNKIEPVKSGFDGLNSLLFECDTPLTSKETDNEFYIDMGQNKGSFKLIYNMYGGKDKLEIFTYPEHKKIYTTKGKDGGNYVKSKGEDIIEYNSKFLNVVIEGKEKRETRWEIKLSCPQKD